MPSTASVNLRRAYFDSRYGQLHVRTAFPNTGGFDERTALVCLHGAPYSSRTFLSLLPEIGTDRSVYAVDLPGYGDSDAPSWPPTLSDYATAIVDLLDGLRLREVDVLGVHAGAAIAAEVAIAKPQQVRRLALVGVPAFAATERDAFEREPWPAAPAEDGGHAAREWRRLAALRGPGVTLEQFAAAHADALRNGPRATYATLAALRWEANARLKLVQQPALVVRAKDSLAEQTQRAREWLPNATWRDLPQYGEGLIDVAPREFATLLREFLDVGATRRSGGDVRRPLRSRS